MNKTATIATLSVSAFVIAGCAMPVPLKVASWALDGISYVVTEKSVTDHGLSAVAQKDCAVWRGVTEGELCREWQEGGGTLVADASKDAAPTPKSVHASGFAPAAHSDIPPLQTSLDDGRPRIDNMVAYPAVRQPASPARMPSVTRPGYMPTQAPQRIKSQRKPAAPVRQAVRQGRVMKAKLKVAPKPVRAAYRPPALKAVNKARSAQRVEPTAGVYFVIGSFRNYANARLLTGRHASLVPVVLAADLDGAPVYRVVVGPAAPGREKTLHRRIARAGLSDTWAIRVRPGDWTVAHAVIERKKRAGIGSELAGLPR